MTSFPIFFFAARLAWRQLIYDKPKLIAATLGVLFASVLVFMQLGFLDSLYASAASAPIKMRADLFVLHKQTEALWRPVQFERSALMRALGHPDIRAVYPMYMSLGQFKNMDTRIQRTLMVYGYDLNSNLIDSADIRARRDDLKRQDVALFDIASRPEFGPVSEQISEGRDVTEINGRRITIVGTFRMGTTFAADGNVVASELNFHRIFPQRSLDKIDLGFVLLSSGADVRKAQADLLALMGREMRVFNYDQLVEFEKGYWENSAPMGFIFGFGVVMGLVVGMVIVYQILFTDVSNNLSQYATLKAMGYSHFYLQLVVLSSAIYLALLGFVPGLALSLALYRLAEQEIFIPFPMPLGKVATVFAFILTMCSLAGALAIRRLKAANPADMF
ncbi:ABC transporter permease DevC [Methylocystis sp. JR02]|uniref:ABC transporter permease DevC n=1 Tax=Methylocystis sp. JR02 TaxID=3046284 RepID=UPI0024BA4E98|nr:ABC transporter permease DevC [Methylocystis sp. JR02]MDJ0450862.1 ABC transporter permease DevC [Methylocystis sp. JR02]